MSSCYCCVFLTITSYRVWVKTSSWNGADRLFRTLPLAIRQFRFICLYFNFVLMFLVICLQYVIVMLINAAVNACVFNWFKNFITRYESGLFPIISTWMLLFVSAFLIKKIWTVRGARLDGREITINKRWRFSAYSVGWPLANYKG